MTAILTDITGLYLCPCQFSQGILSRKVISDAFFNAEVESDIRENALIDTWRFTTNSDREVYMRKCEESRVTKLYEHGQCSEAGLERGIKYYAAYAYMYLGIVRINCSNSTIS